MRLCKFTPHQLIILATVVPEDSYQEKLYFTPFTEHTQACILKSGPVALRDSMIAGGGRVL